jgi:hypothetical protein
MKSKIRNHIERMFANVRLTVDRNMYKVAVFETNFEAYRLIILLSSMFYVTVYSP